MIDRELDTDYAALEREQPQATFASRPVKQSGTLATLPSGPDLSVFETSSSEELNDQETAAVTPTTSTAPAADIVDPFVHLRYVRLGLISALLLVILLLWLWQRRHS